jgi:very-short-patch-repair endonuclease
MQSAAPANTALVAIVPSRRDWNLIHEQGWYRIPVRTAPAMVKSGSITHLAFYFPSEFGEEKYSIRWYAKVEGITIRKRKELLDEPRHRNAEQDYFVLAVPRLRLLPNPIHSRKPRRLLFLPTTVAKLLTAPEMNYLFNDSPLENLLWTRLMELGIPSERQYEVPVGPTRFKLDIAVFCKQRSIGLECDGDEHHMRRSAVERDKRRSNILQSLGWSVMHFTTQALSKDMPGTLQLVQESIAQYGGLWHPGDQAP